MKKLGRVISISVVVALVASMCTVVGLAKSQPTLKVLKIKKTVTTKKKVNKFVRINWEDVKSGTVTVKIYKGKKLKGTIFTKTKTLKGTKYITLPAKVKRYVKVKDKETGKIVRKAKRSFLTPGTYSAVVRYNGKKVTRKFKVKEQTQYGPVKEIITPSFLITIPEGYRAEGLPPYNAMKVDSYVSSTTYRVSSETQARYATFGFLKYANGMSTDNYAHHVQAIMEKEGYTCTTFYSNLIGRRLVKVVYGVSGDKHRYAFGRIYKDYFYSAIIESNSEFTEQEKIDYAALFLKNMKFI